MPLSDHIKHMEPDAPDFAGDPDFVTQFEPYYYVLLDLRGALDPDDQQPWLTNHEVEDAVVGRLAQRYGPEHVTNLDSSESGPRAFTLTEHEPVTFNSGMTAFGMQSNDRDSLAVVCEVVDVLAAEAQGEPSFMDIYGQRFDEVPSEYKRLVGRVMRLARLRQLLERDRGAASVIVGYEKRLVHKAYDDVMAMDDVPEQDLTPEPGTSGHGNGR